MRYLSVKGFVIRAVMALAALVMASSIQAASWTSKAKSLFEDDEYEACIELTEKYKDDLQANMFLAFSHLQQNVFNGSKYDKEKYKAYRLKLEAKLGADNLNDVLYFVGLNDKPYVVKEARSLAKDLFKNINDIDDVQKLIPFLKVEDEDTRDLTLKKIYDIFKPKRDYVNKGGSLRPKDIDAMSSKALIEPLVSQLENRNAQKILVLIEEPVLPYLDGADGEAAVKLDISINKAIANRQKKYPDSNWSSAVGKER